MNNKPEQNQTNYSEEQVLEIIEELRQASWRSEMCYGSLGIIHLHRGWNEFQNLTSIQKLNIARKIFYYYEKYRSNDKRFSGIVLDAIMNPELSDKQKKDLWDINPGGMSIANVIKIRDKRNLRIQQEMEAKIQRDSLVAFKEIYKFPNENFRVVKIEGSEIERETAFKKVTLDMGNCLGGKHLQDYLRNTEPNGGSIVCIMLANRDIFDEKTGKKIYSEGQAVIAFDYYKHQNEFHEIEGSKKQHYGKISRDSVLAKNIIEFLEEIASGNIDVFNKEARLKEGLIEGLFI